MLILVYGRYALLTQLARASLHVPTRGVATYVTDSGR